MKANYKDLYKENGNYKVFVCGTMLSRCKYYKEIDLSDYDTLEREYYFYHDKKEHEDDYYHLSQEDIIQAIIDAYLEHDFFVRRIDNYTYLIQGNQKQTR